MKEVINLQQRAFYKVLMLFILTFLLTGAISIVAVDRGIRNDAKANLAVRIQVVEQVFNDYLTRAEYEMGYISQDLVLSNYQSGDELKMLFSHHEILFFGGLDFFYIDWSKRKGATDPRARVYTQDKLPTLLSTGKINHWVKVTTDDDAILLMYKKKIVSRDRVLLGYLYGFISLNNNLTLSSELLDGAESDLVQVYDRHTDALLLKESQVGFDPSDSVVSTTRDMKTPVYGSKFRISIAKRMPITEVMISSWLRVLLLVFSVLAVLYVFLILLFKRLVFAPLSMIAKQPENDQLVFTELEPIQTKNLQYRSYLDAKESRFQLLLESTHSAIIFCNEMAEVKEINREAMQLFPQYEHSRTVFDFMPISCHQAIQEALKGGIGVSFELTIAHINGIYHWQAYSFMNENSFRSIVLVGRNTTQEKRLSWQLEQLKPSSLDLSRRLEVDMLLNEMTQLSQLPSYSPKGYVQGWIGLVLTILEGAQSEVEDAELESIGHVFSCESSHVMQVLGLDVGMIRIDCGVESGAVEISANAYFKMLLRLSVMMSVTNAMEDRSISLRFDQGMLEIVVSNDILSRPFFNWASTIIIKQLGGQFHKLRSNALKIHVPFQSYAQEVTALADDLIVAWVINDYPNSDRVQESLVRLGVQLETYLSSDDFFMQATAAPHFDAVVIGCHREVDIQRGMTKNLEIQHNRTELPVIWLNSTPQDTDAHDVFSVTGCVFDYNLQQAIAKASQRAAIVPTYLGEQGLAWVIVGGSRVAKAIWYAELEKKSVMSQWLADLSEYEAFLPYHSDIVIILLEPQVSSLLLRIQANYPKVRFFAVQKWPNQPDNVTLFEMNTPYSGEQIDALKEFIQC
ncbi:hypothetical protein [Marinomonas flavescens]|uniref:hypothetical protein n=1 Tax=Marinomonas flavescens TaxID=2529379 RepID=UPI0010561016|nr:hypothetical protein [Marinomonas flavescens]